MHKWTVNRVLDLAMGVRLALGTRVALKLSDRDFDELHRDAWTTFEKETGWTFAEVDELRVAGVRAAHYLEVPPFHEEIDGPVIP